VLSDCAIGDTFRSLGNRRRLLRHTSAGLWVKQDPAGPINRRSFELMPVIAMSREMGSLGRDVAYGVGEFFNIRVKHHEIIDSVGSKSRLRKSHVITYLQGKLGLLDKLTSDQAGIAIHSADEILALAIERPQGIVLRGWGATALLREVPHVVCVRVCAPTGLRVERMMRRLDSHDRETVAREIAHSDESHQAIMRRHFNIEASDATQYDVVLNTERMSVAECVDAVVHAARSADFAETEASRARLLDVALVARCRGRLRADSATSRCKLTLGARNGRVTLGGTVESHATALDCERVIAAVPGVLTLENRLKRIEDAGDPARLFQADVFNRT
jgi:cytidylate kinase